MNQFRGKWHWVALASAVLLLAALLFAGWWRGTGTGPQVQVPMFYDAHYLYPRPWTQEQEAPGVPEPARLAFFGRNRVSQSFVSATDSLAGVELWLEGPAGVAVDVALTPLDSADSLPYTATAVLDGSGGLYRFAVPPLDGAAGQRFRMTLAAPDASAEAPVLTRTVGGDRIGGSVQINEYSRPGNLLLVTLSDSDPLGALAEQVLPSLFYLRLQQYKPTWLKGGVFAGLLLAVAVLTWAFLILSLPRSFNKRHATVWSLSLLLFALAGWQLLDSRAVVAAERDAVLLAPSAEPVPVSAEPEAGYRLFNDLSTVLWTTERLPEKRWAVATQADGRSAVETPGAFRIETGLIVPPASRLTTGVVADQPVTAQVVVGSDVVASAELQPGAEQALTVDLSPWAGQTQRLSLVTDSAEPDATVRWIQPQLETQAPWLLPDSAEIDGLTRVDATYDDQIELVGYTTQDDAIILFWRALQPVADSPTVFVHFLGADGALVAQDDAPPVRGAYPASVWQPNTLIADARPLPAELAAELPAGQFDVAVGLYDPSTGVRWPAVATASGASLGDSVVLPGIAVGE